MSNFIIFLGVLIFTIGVFIIVDLYSSKNSKVVPVTPNETPPVTPLPPDFTSETVIKSEPVKEVINTVPPTEEVSNIVPPTEEVPNIIPTENVVVLEEKIAEVILPPGNEVIVENTSSTTTSVSYPSLTEIAYKETIDKQPVEKKKKKYYSNQKMKKNI